MSTALITLDAAKSFVIVLSPEEKQVIDSALESAALIGKVSDQITQAAAVEAQRNLKSVLVQVERQRKEMKAPALEYGRKIDAHSDQISSEVNSEYIRLSRLIGSFQALEAKKALIAKELRDKELQRIAMETLTAVQQARNPEEEEAIREQSSRMAAMVPPVPEPPKASGQVVKPEWEFDVSNIWDLARAHPGCVKIEPLRGQIKALLNSGVKAIPGVTNIRQETKSGVRISQSALIET